MEDRKSKTILGYVMNSRPAWVTGEPVSQRRRKLRRRRKRKKRKRKKRGKKKGEEEKKSIIQTFLGRKVFMILGILE